MCKIPLEVYKKLNNKKDISVFLLAIRKGLDKNIYVHTDTIEQIIRILVQYISNPNANGYVIGI
jgi:hypothetical protein